MEELTIDMEQIKTVAASARRMSIQSPKKPKYNKLYMQENVIYEYVPPLISPTSARKKPKAAKESQSPAPKVKPGLIELQTLYTIQTADEP